MNLYDYNKTPLKIDKPIRLIELFAGIGSQAKALERLGANFEHYRVCEFDKYAINSYNAVHGTDFATSDITQISSNDLGIVDTNKYCYIMTYSFPCQDLSLAGQQKLMAKGSGTRSSLLWEVERLLNECDELPQILLMENVTQVHGKKNKAHFDEWIAFLESKGYSNYWKDLNAKNFGIPQNRNRCFMVSVLGNYTYEFPQEFPLELRLKDVLEDNVDEKFYLSGKMINYLHTITETNKARGNGNVYAPANIEGVSKCVTTKEGSRVKDNFIEEATCIQVGTLSGGKWDKMHDISRRVYGGDGCSPTIHTCGSGNLEPKVVEPKVIQAPHGYMKGNVQDVCPSITTSSWEHNNFLAGLRIRKLTPKECWRLMGFDDADFEKACAVNSNSQLYKQAGNSIVVDVLYYIFKEMM